MLTVQYLQVPDTGIGYRRETALTAFRYAHNLLLSTVNTDVPSIHVNDINTVPGSAQDLIVKQDINCTFSSHSDLTL
jgi:hypothetical protein